MEPSALQKFDKRRTNLNALSASGTLAAGQPPLRELRGAGPR